MAEWKARFTTVKETEMRTVKAKLKNRDDELLQTLVRELGKTEEEILAQGVRALYGDIMLGQGSAMTRLSENDYHARMHEHGANDTYYYHYHDYYEITFYLGEQDTDYLRENVHYTMRKGDIIFCRMFENHIMDCPNNDGHMRFCIGMEPRNLADMRRIFGGDPEGKLQLLLHYAGEERGIADPWYTGDFEATYADVCAGCAGLLETLKQK